MKGFQTFGDVPPDETDVHSRVLSYSHGPKNPVTWNILPWANTALFFAAMAAVMLLLYASNLVSGDHELAGLAISASALLAISISILGYLICGRQPDRRGTRRVLASLFSGILLLLLGGYVLVFPSHRMSPSVECMNNLRQIANAAMMYADSDPQGRFPPTPNLILATQDVPPEVFVCPKSSDTPASGATTQATANNLTTGGHFSYVYLGNGLSTKSGADAVLMYEPKNLHNNRQNFAYVGGYVMAHSPATAASIIAELNAGQNPPRAERIK